MKKEKVLRRGWRWSRAAVGLVLLLGLTLYPVSGVRADWARDTDLSNAGASFWGEDADDSAGCAVAGAGDVNGDGYDDILIGASGDEGGGANAGQTYLVLSDYSAAASNPYKRVLPAGDVTPEDFSTARTVIDFDSGTAGETTVTIHRSSPSPGNSVAPVWWEISTTRSGFSNDIDVTLHYLEGEITGLTEGDLKVYTRPDASSAWSEWASISQDLNRNTLTAQGLNGFSQFAIGEEAPAGGQQRIYLPLVSKRVRLTE